MNISQVDIRILLALGFVPYYISRKRLADGSRRVQIRALFWSFETRKPPKGPRSWTLHVTLIERLRDAVWAVADHVRGGRNR